MAIYSNYSYGNGNSYSYGNSSAGSAGSTGSAGSANTSSAGSASTPQRNSNETPTLAYTTNAPSTSGVVGTPGVIGSAGSAGSAGSVGLAGSAGSAGPLELVYGTWGQQKYNEQLADWKKQNRNLRYYKKDYDRYLDILKEARKYKENSTLKSFESIDDEIAKYSEKCKTFECKMQSAVDKMNEIRMNAKLAGVSKTIVYSDMEYQTKSWEAWED